jgi:hypothetical protein
MRSVLLMVIVSGVVAVISALPVLEVCSDGGIRGHLVAFGFPGLLVSIAVSGNAHAFNAWIMAISNWVLYALVLLALQKIIVFSWKVTKRNGA